MRSQRDATLRQIDGYLLRRLRSLDARTLHLVENAGVPEGLALIP